MHHTPNIFRTMLEFMKVLGLGNRNVDDICNSITVIASPFIMSYSLVIMLQLLLVPSLCSTVL